MKYTLVYVKAAENQLTRIYLNAPDPQAVSDASNRIDRELANDAHRKGSPRAGYRIYTDDPLAVLFHVDPGDRMVKIVQVGRIK
jgi:hypothetical protein